MNEATIAVLSGVLVTGVAAGLGVRVAGPISSPIKAGAAGAVVGGLAAVTGVLVAYLAIIAPQNVARGPSGRVTGGEE